MYTKTWFLCEIITFHKDIQWVKFKHNMHGIHRQWITIAFTWSSGSNLQGLGCPNVMKIGYYGQHISIWHMYTYVLGICGDRSANWTQAIYLNSSAPSAVYMGQWIRFSLFQIMACRQSIIQTNVGLLSIWPFSEILTKIQTFYSRNASETIVWEIVAILSKGRRVK